MSYKRISPQPVSEGGTGSIAYIPFAVICAGQTPTSGMQSIATPGNANQVLTSQGAGLLPIFVNLSTLINLTTGTGFTGILIPAYGGTGLNTITDHSVMVGSGAAAVTPLAVGADGQVLLGATGQDPAFASLTSIGGTVVFTPGANSLNLEVAGGGTSWAREANAAVSLEANHGYINTNVGLTTFTLPLTASLGSEIHIVGESTGLWTIAQNNGQTIQYGNINTTTGVAGSITSTNRYDTVSLICRIADTTWSVVKSVGILNIV